MKRAEQVCGIVAVQGPAANHAPAPPAAEDGSRVLLLEANALAGLMCTHSYIGFMARAEGMSGRDLLSEIVQDAVSRMGLGA